VDSSHFSLHFDSILYVERFDAQFNPSVRTNWRPKDECSVLNITLLVGGNAGNFICRAPHFSTVSGSIKSRTGVIILTKTSKLSHLPAIQT
jgi:hypothetical protein